MAEIEVGIVDSFFAKPVVAGINVTGDINVGDKLHIQGHTTDMTLTVDSMEVEHGKIEAAHKGDSVGIKVTDRVRPHDKVYKVTED